eukprot:TRINITY_DN24592_c1_g1_i2.p1 TRINITY_DN24592_c1_g1~~TRINITY_DN24592_c1_g1_i2.p1  ORF type:complete len:726 (+),score=192.18 TRINITY_DN24592_c1_g1_i2:251-2428(+)
MTMSGTKSQKIPAITFGEAFARILLHQTGLSVSKRAELNQDLLKQELELAVRQDGLTGEHLFSTDVGSEVTALPHDVVASVKQSASGAAAGGGGAGAGPKGKGRGKGGKGRESSSSSKWSDNAEELANFIQKLGPRNPNLCSEVFLKPFFSDLKLQGLNIWTIGEDVIKFSKLTSLDLSENSLTEIDQLPPSLRFFKVYNNQISRISSRPLPSLCFLGIGNNPLGKQGLGDVVRCFPNLLSLDLSHTEVVSLDDSIEKMKALKSLRQLCFLASPVCLVPFYRLALLRALPQIQALDSILITDEEYEDAAKLKMASLPELEPWMIRKEPTEGAGETEGDAAAAGEAAEAEAVEVPKYWPGCGGPGWLRFTLELGNLKQHHGLLKEALMPPEAAGAVSATVEVEEDGAPASSPVPAGEEDELPKDPLSEKVGQEGELRLSFELPDGSWINSGTMKLAKKTWEVEEDEPPPPVYLRDEVKLQRLKTASGEALSFELDLCKGGLRRSTAVVAAAVAAGEDAAKDVTTGADEAGMLQICRWLYRGLRFKLFYVPPPPPPKPAPESEEAAEGEAAAADAEAEPKDAEAEAADANKDEESKKLPEIPLGGCVIPLEGTFLWQSDPAVLPDSVRECGELPLYPPPWRLDVPEAQIVPMAYWLHPETQVPHPGNPAPKCKHHDAARTAKCALLDLSVVLYAEPPPTEEAPESEEETPVNPKANPKGKAKAKAKK